MRIFETTPIIFPQRLLMDGITRGEARVAISVDHTGKLTDLLVVGYSRREFADAAQTAIRQWSYEPMQVLSEHVATQAVLRIDFSANGAVISIDGTSDVSARLLPFRREQQFGPCPLRELDGIPMPVNFVEPVYPADLARHGVRGSAVIEFYVDEAGNVRVPAVIDSDFWELGSLAMDAVRQWQFAPPTRHGQPVLVRVRQRIVFGAVDS